MTTSRIILSVASLALATLATHAATPTVLADEKPVILPAQEVRVDRLDQVQKDVRQQLNQLRSVARVPVKVPVDLPLLKLTRANLPTPTAPAVPPAAPVVIAGV